MRTRRRGAELDAALLDAVWDVVLEGGYAALTFEAVAARAGTSRPVVHRRWSTKQELLLAALRHRGAQQVPVEVDTGSLRGDLVAMLRGVSAARTSAIVVMAALANEAYHDTGLPPAELREQWVGERGGALRQIVDRALARGEVDPERVTPRTVSTAMDLLRLEMLMRLAPVPDDVIEQIVDEVAVPLLRGRLGPA